jgi:hypothetical protein
VSCHGAGRLANSIRSFSAHETRGAILPALRAQKLSLQINVELVGSRKFLDNIRTGQPRLRNRRDLEKYTSGALVQPYMLQIAG